MESVSEQRNLYGFVVRERDRRHDRRKNPSHRSFDIKQLWSRSHEILQLDSMGYKGTEIAKLLGVHPVTVSNTLNSSLGVKKKADIRKSRDKEYEELREEVIELTKKSLKVYNKILEDEAENMKLKKDTADTVVLELSGLRAPTRVDTRSLHMSVTQEEIEEFKRRGIEAARAAGKLVDIEENKDG